MCPCVCPCVCVSSCTYVCPYVCVHVCVSVCTCACVCPCVLSTYVCVCPCTCVGVCAHDPLGVYRPLRRHPSRAQWDRSRRGLSVPTTGQVRDGDRGCTAQEAFVPYSTRHSTLTESKVDRRRASSTAHRVRERQFGLREEEKGTETQREGDRQERGGKDAGVLAYVLREYEKLR